MWNCYRKTNALMEISTLGEPEDAKVLHLLPRMSTPSVAGDRVSLEDAMNELGDRTALQALAGAYSDRLGLIRADAPAKELMASAALIATLERTCLSQH